MTIKTLTAALLLALLFLTTARNACAQGSGEPQIVFLDENRRPILVFTEKPGKGRPCGAFASYTLTDTQEEAIAIRVGHVHSSGLGIKNAVTESGWLYIMAARIIFVVEKGDPSHAFDLRRTELMDKPAGTLDGKIFISPYVGVKILLKEKLQASNSNVQKFVFAVLGKDCKRMNPAPYTAFVHRAVNDFDGALAEFKRVADSLRLSGKVYKAPAFMVPPGNPAAPPGSGQQSTGGTSRNPADAELRTVLRKLYWDAEGHQ